MARKSKERRGNDRRGMAGMVGQGGIRHDRAWSGKDWQGRQGEATKGGDWLGEARQDR